MKGKEKHIYIDCTGMTDTERTVAMLTAILEHLNLAKPKRKAKDIRQQNREFERKRKKKH